jgi:hypothetical protein
MLEYCCTIFRAVPLLQEKPADPHHLKARLVAVGSACGGMRLVPGKPALVAGVMPEADRELDRLDRLPAVERHGLAVGLDLPDITSVWNRSQLLSGATQTI